MHGVYHSPSVSTPRSVHKESGRSDFCAVRCTHYTLGGTAQCTQCGVQCTCGARRREGEGAQGVQRTFMPRSSAIWRENAAPPLPVRYTHDVSDRSRTAHATGRGGEVGRGICARCTLTCLSDLFVTYRPTSLSLSDTHAVHTHRTSQGGVPASDGGPGRRGGRRRTEGRIEGDLGVT